MKPSEVRPRPRLPQGFTLEGFHHRDVATVRDITRKALGERYPASLFLDIHAWWPEGFMVVKEGDVLAGFIAGVVAAPKRARVLMLAVREAYRSRGIGTALMAEFTSRALERSLKSIELEVRVSNEGAIRFYKRLGFSVRYLLPRFYTDKEDGYKMAKDLR